ncbi:MAG: DUF2318 domain-containing protein [Chloroflexota bacterium]|nr:DUF2318 domain-containing protein [Chloroflexota bacterium]
MSKKPNQKRPASSAEVRSAKRDQFVKERQAPAKPKSRIPVWLIAAPILVAVLAGALVLRNSQQTSSAAAAAQSQVASTGTIGFLQGINSQAPNKRYPAVTPDADGAFRFPTAAFADGKARFFSTTLPNGKSINFFAIKSSDGVIRAAIDACDVCYSARKGYYQEGDVMVCNNCGQRFASARINEVKGGCNPAPLTRSVQGDNLIIKLADLQNDNRAETGQPLF